MDDNKFLPFSSRWFVGSENAGASPSQTQGQDDSVAGMGRAIAESAGMGYSPNFVAR
jgi:hypothetical protein